MTSKKDLLNDDMPEQGDQNDGRATQTPGQILADAREQKGLSQQQVADSLRLRLAVVQLIETDQYEKLASSTFVRGYLRSMAKALEVPADKVFEAFKEHGFDIEQTSQVNMQSFSRRKVRERNDSRLKWISYAIILIVLALVLIWWWQESNFSLNRITGSENAPTEQEAQQERESVQSIPQVVRPTPTQMSEDEAVARSSTAGNADNDNATETAAENPETLDSATAERASSQRETTEPASAEPVPAELATTQPATTQPENSAVTTAEPTTNAAAAAPEQLVFEFNQACWVKVTDATGEDIAIGVKAAGYRMPLTGEAPFDIILCKPEAVTLTYNGENVDLDEYVRNRSVTLTLD